MKSTRFALVALALTMVPLACQNRHPDDNTPAPLPDPVQPDPEQPDEPAEPDPQPTDTDTSTDTDTEEPDEPTPTPVPVTCEGMGVGRYKDLPCPVGQAGMYRLVCGAEGKWLEVVNTCAKIPEPTPPSVKVALPFAYKVKAGDQVALGVPDQDGVTFAWSTGERGSSIVVTPERDRIYTVTATRTKDSSKASASVTVITQLKGVK